MSLIKSSLVKFLLLTVGSSVVHVYAHYSSSIHIPQFTQWRNEFRKFYDTMEEEEERFLIWVKNNEFIERHNAQTPKPPFTMKHNYFSDMSHEEYLQHNKLGSYGRGIVTPTPEMLLKESTTSSSSDVAAEQRRRLSERDEESLDVWKNLPEYVNWVEVGAVTPAKNQGRCGSCWSFSAIGSIEGAKFLNDGELVSLSEQMMMDCDHTDASCEGGIMETGFQWESREGGLCSESDYPYLAKDSYMCWDSNCTEVSGTRVKSFTRLNGGNVDELRHSIAIQPTSIAMAANSMEFQFYHEGVFNGTCSHALDHGILAVGYGYDEASDLDYFLVKNSWGEMWGENGFFKISTFQAEPGDMGMCGILNNYNTAPTLF